jgi:hypothetical protein
MKRGLNRLLARVGWLAIMGTAVLPTACHLDPCYPGIDLQARYRVDVVEAYTSQSSFTYDGTRIHQLGVDVACPANQDGVGSGSVFELQATGTMSDTTGSCSIGTAKILSTPSPIELVGPSTSLLASRVAGTGSPLLSATSDVDIPGCTGSIALVLLPGDLRDGVLATPQPGQLPPVIFYRFFHPTSGSCVECNDNFVVQLTKE